MTKSATSLPGGEKKGMHPVLLSFLLAMAVATAIFLPFYIIDKGFFIFAGDYNLQQIPFYMYVQQFIKDGGGTWSWATDIGSSVVNSYSFYNIGSPFLWLSALFPSRWMPFLMVPLFILKFGCIAASSCLYFSRYAKTRNMPVICSLIYAFCGFNVYNIFFNHMLDPVVIFPLMLWAMDGFIYEKRRGVFALMVGLSLLDSYFFFIGNVVFILIYFVVKVATGEYRLTPRDFGLLVLEAVLGVGIGMALALPSFFNLLDNPRTGNFANGFNLILYWNVHQYANILTNMFLPPDPSYMPNIFTEGAIKHTSMTAFLPIVSMAGVMAYCKSRKKTGTKYLLFISLVMALVPMLNSSFYAFNASYYARWYYMPILIMVFATMRSLEDADIDLLGGTKMAFGITALFGILGILPRKDGNEWKIGLGVYQSKFWLTYLTAMLAMLIFYILVKYYRHRARFARLLLAAVMGFSVVYSVINLSLSKFPQWYNDANFRTYMYDGPEELDLPDDQFYRIDTYELPPNLGLWADKSSLQTFNSVVTPSIMEFYPFLGVTRDVSSRPDHEKYAFRGLLSVRYMLMPADSESSFLAHVGSNGWQFYDYQGPYAIYENQNYLPLGYTYDQYIPMENLELVPVADRAPMLMQAIGLYEEDAERYAYLFSGEPGARIDPLGAQDDEGEKTHTPSSWYSYGALGFEQYVGHCADRRATASYDVQADSSGFRVKISLAKDNLVYFGVPYDSGFTATVNGQPAEVLKVSGGMMAVFAPQGDCEIVFTYQTPGFRQGLAVSAVSLVLVGAYMAWDAMRRRKRQLLLHARPPAGKP